MLLRYTWRAGECINCCRGGLFIQVGTALLYDCKCKYKISINKFRCWGPLLGPSRKGENNCERVPNTLLGLKGTGSRALKTTTYWAEITENNRSGELSFRSFSKKIQLDDSYDDSTCYFFINFQENSLSFADCQFFDCTLVLLSSQASVLKRNLINAIRLLTWLSKSNWMKICWS